MKHFLKRSFDFFAALIALILLLPLLLILAVVVRLKLGSPVIFKQQRPGLHGKPFFMYKFRTMTDEKDSDGNLLPDDQRLPRFGQMLRSTSLDELPEFLCVLKGDLSIVGPRPLMMKYLPRYTPQQARRHEVRPGITGWAQVNGRNNASWEEKFEFDVWYVDNWNLWLDLKILLKTVAQVVLRKDINQEGQATAEEFMPAEQQSQTEREA